MMSSVENGPVAKKAKLDAVTATDDNTKVPSNVPCSTSRPTPSAVPISVESSAPSPVVSVCTPPPQQPSPVVNAHSLAAHSNAPATVSAVAVHKMIDEELKRASEPSKRPQSSESHKSSKSYGSHFDLEEDRKKRRNRKDMRIQELFEENLAVEVKGARPRGVQKMEGDIPTLGLHKNFFVEGIKIGWPFPAVMLPQRQMALHLVKALKNRRHVVLESPTGTGKSAAILCSVLAWQRYHHKLNPRRNEKGELMPPPTIIYCSRTHSQVAQMVKSLRKTPYRPRMTVLGSRDRLCINQKIRGSDKPLNINQECQTRVKNTDRSRKETLSPHGSQSYYDEDPPTGLDADKFDCGAREEGTEQQQASTRSNRRPCCPHYRQLGPSRTAKLVVEQFLPPARRVNCCSKGGEKTKLGTHDIEDMVGFAKDPYTIRDVAIYRKPGTPFFLNIEVEAGKAQVGLVHPGGPVAEEGTLAARDEILRVNGRVARGMGLNQVADAMRQTADGKPLVLDITRHSEMVTLEEDREPSIHSPCPYYISRHLAKHAELIFAPYNYVLDPFIRKSLDIGLNGAVVVLDEAHNIESTLRDSGSGVFSEIEICEIISMLSLFSNSESNFKTEISVEGTLVDRSVVAHELLLFFEKVMFFLIEAKANFERRPNGAQKAIADWRKFNSSDETQYDMTFHGPTGYGERGKPVGCKRFFELIDVLPESFENLERYLSALDGHLRQDEMHMKVFGTILDKVEEILCKVAFAAKCPEHYFIATVAKANGSHNFAAGGNPANMSAQEKPKSLPFVEPRKATHADLPLHPCLHKSCSAKKEGRNFTNGHVRHGDFCNGQKPPWLAHLVVELLTPSHLMKDLRQKCRTVVLASGSLAPIASLCAELGLNDARVSTTKPSPASVPSRSDSDYSQDLKQEKPSDECDLLKLASEPETGRLQTKPKPLEANHVINLEKQLLAVSVGKFPDGTPLTVKSRDWAKPDFIPKLGDAIASVVESIPYGGVLIFFPSYAFLRRCVNQWNPRLSRPTNSWAVERDRRVWDRLIQSKGKVIVEPTGSQAKFEEAKEEYANRIRQTRNCVLLAVFRGKMSEGISFNDDFARGVVCLGVPYPNSFDRRVKAKKTYNDEQRRLMKRTDILPGNDWYSQQAYRAIAQALGRCIRHSGDYGTIILMDSRHCDDGSPGDGVCPAHRQLPKWMRLHVRNVSERGRGGVYELASGPNVIVGGWSGLRQEMSKFFQTAPPFAESVLRKQAEDLKRAQENEGSSEHKFDRQTGKWSSKNSFVSVSTTKLDPTETASSPSIAISQSQSTPIRQPESMWNYRSDRSQNSDAPTTPSTKDSPVDLT